MQGLIEKVAILILNSSGFVVERYNIHMKVNSHHLMAYNRKRVNVTGFAVQWRLFICPIPYMA